MVFPRGLTLHRLLHSIIEFRPSLGLCVGILPASYFSRKIATTFASQNYVTDIKIYNIVLDLNYKLNKLFLEIHEKLTTIPPLQHENFHHRVIQYWVLILSESISIASHHYTLQIMSHMDNSVVRGFTPPSLWRNTFSSHWIPSGRCIEMHRACVALTSLTMTNSFTKLMITMIGDKRFAVTLPLLSGLNLSHTDKQNKLAQATSH